MLAGALAFRAAGGAAQAGSELDQIEWGGAGNRIRTYDPRITNALLYQLSYPGAGAANSIGPERD